MGCPKRSLMARLRRIISLIRSGWTALTRSPALVDRPSAPVVLSSTIAASLAGPSLTHVTRQRRGEDQYATRATEGFCGRCPWPASPLPLLLPLSGRGRGRFYARMAAPSCALQPATGTQPASPASQQLHQQRRAALRRTSPARTSAPAVLSCPGARLSPRPSLCQSPRASPLSPPLRELSSPSPCIAPCSTSLPLQQQAGSAPRPDSPSLPPLPSRVVWCGVHRL